MSRRPVNSLPRRLVDSNSDPSLESDSETLHHTAKPFPLISACLLLLGALLLLSYTFSCPGFLYLSKQDGDGHHAFQLSKHGLSIRERFLGNESDAESSIDDGEGDISARPECKSVACQAIPFLQEVYGKSMNRLLHIGPGTCGLILKLVKEVSLEAWGIQPYEMKPPVHSICDSLIRKGLIRVAEVDRPLPYRMHSFSLVLVTDILETLTRKELNATLPELARVSKDGFVLFINSKNVRRVSDHSGANVKTSKTPKLRNKEWWQQYFQMHGLQENEEATEAFEKLRSADKYFRSDYHVFHFVSTYIPSDDTSSDSTGKHNESEEASIE